jgi:hypothetical protein
MKDFKQIKKQAVRQQFRDGGVFQEGDYVMSSLTGDKGRIHRSGVNYVIAVTEDGRMFRAWVKDIREVNVIENINKEKKSIFFTNGKTETNESDSSS